MRPPGKRRQGSEGAGQGTLPFLSGKAWAATAKRQEVQCCCRHSLFNTPPPHTHTRTTTTTKNQLLGEAEVGCSLEPRRVRPAGAKLGNSAPKNKNNLKAGGTTIQLLLGLSPQITWALEPKEATLSLQDTDLVSDQSQNTPTVAPTLQLETSKPE